MSELVRFSSGDNDVAKRTQVDPQNPTAKFVPLEPGQVLFGLEVVEDGSLLGTIYYDYKDKNGIITRVSMGNGGAGGSGDGIIKTLATTDGTHDGEEVTAAANVIIPLPKKIFANLLSAKTQFNFPKVHDPSNTAYVNEDAAPGQSYLYGNGLHMVNPFNTLQDSWIRTIGKQGSAEATLELAMRDNASSEYIYDQIVARHYKADGAIVTDTNGRKREVVILGKNGESHFPGPVTSDGGFIGDLTGNATSATKAQKDWYNQVIDSTYLSKIIKTKNDGSVFEITSYDGRYTPVGATDAKKDVITIPGATTAIAGLITTGDQTITGNKTIDGSGSLTVAKTGGFIYSGIQEDKATNANLPLWFATSGTNGTPKYSTELTYNPSTGTVTAKKFAGPATSATYDAEGGAIHDKYLKRAGGTMTGALNFADNTYNAFGDDVEIGSQNAKGKLNIHGKNGATGIVFVPYSGSTSQTISIDGAGVMTITGTLKATLDGNASTSTTLKTARNFNITDSSAAYSGPNVSFNGSADVTLHMPDTFTGTLKGNADTATKLATARTLWGQSFNGTANISGNMSSVGNVLSTKTNTYTIGSSSNVWKAIYATAFYGALSGNASSATKLETARSFHITDSSATYNGASVTFDGTGDITLHMPDTFAGTLKGNADSATKLKTARTLWGQSFNGSANVTGAMSNVGNITSLKTNTHDIGSSSNVWKNVYATTFHGALDGKATSAGSADMANQVTHVLTIEGQSYDGSTDVAVGNTVFYIVGNSTDTTAGTWTGTDSKIKSYYNGLTIIYVPKVDGASTTTLNLNGLGAKTCYYSNTSKLTTHFAKGTPILLTYIDGYWKRADYDSNTNTQVRVYRQITSDSSYNAEYPLLVSRTQASGIGTAGTNSSYASVYGVMNDDVSKIPTINIHTGAITAKSFKGTATNAINDVNGAKIDETYLKRAGGTMTGNITFAATTFSSNPTDSMGLVWTGGSDTAKIFYRQTANNAGSLVLYVADDGEEYINFLHSKGNAVYLKPNTREFYPSENNTGSLGTSSLKWKNVYATTFTGALSGNAATATKWQTARNFQVDLALDNPATVKVDGTKDVILPVTGILATKHGGTGNSTHTANRLVWSETATKLSATNNHYASATQIAINSTAAPTGYTFLANGKTHLNGDARVTGNLLMTNGGSSILWDSGTVQQRIITTDDSTADTAVFAFQQSENSASSWNNLLTIRDNGRIVLQNEKGGIYKLVTTANTSPLIQLVSDNQDVSIFKVANGTSIIDSWSCGFDLKYIGTGAAIDNLLTLYAGDYHNTGTQVIGWSVNQAGQIGIKTTPNSSYSLNINGNTYSNGKFYINNTTDVTTSNKDGVVVIGPKDGLNLGIDNDEIMARNATAVSTLYLNRDGGLVQIGSGGLYVTGQMKTNGPLLIGSDANGRAKNYIAFYGITGDGPDTWNHTFIGENLFGDTDKSELILFKGNDPGSAPEDMRYASGPGPDRIRHIAAGHLFQIYRTALSGTFATIAQSTVPISIFEVNQQGVVVYNEGTDANNYPAKITFRVKDTVNGTTSTATIAAYSDHGTTSSGSNLVISSGGNTLIQAGEGTYGGYAQLIKTGVNQKEHLYLTADGSVYLCASADTINRQLIWNGTTFYPVLNNTFNLGGSANRWASAHVYRDFNIYGTESTGDESHVRFNASDNTQRAIIAFNGNTTNTLDATTHLKIATNYGDIRLDAASNYINVKGHILPRADFTATNYNIGSTTRRWGNVYANALRLQGPSSDPSEAQGARIEFAYDNGTNRSQPVYISYTPNDNYRAPYGLKIFGTEATNYGAWLEVQGAIGTSSTNLASGIGISLYGGPKNGKPEQGIFYGATGTFGQLKNTTSAAYGVTTNAMYLTVADVLTHGWLFMRGATNVAGITGNGTFLSVVSTGTHIAGNQGKVIIDGTASAGYNMLFRQKSTNGVFTAGAYNAEWNLYYTSNSTISAGTNGTSYGIRLINEAGNTRVNRLGINGEDVNYRLYVNGTSHLTSTVRLESHNQVGFIFRQGTGYDTTLSYLTSGNEAMVFATKNAVTSFIFVNGEDSAANMAADRWTKITPALQIKNNCVYIGSLIGNGVTPSYKLYVNGASYINGNLTIPNNYAYYGILGENNSTSYTNVGGLTWFNIDGTAGCAANVNDTPTSAWWYVLRNRHTNTGNNYYTDVAIPFNAKGIYYKVVQGNAGAETIVNNRWIKVLDDDNYAGVLDGRYVNVTGDTMTGALHFANGTWNKVGDDAQFGDNNTAGSFAIQGINGHTNLKMVTYGNTSYGTITWDGGKFLLSHRLYMSNAGTWSTSVNYANSLINMGTRSNNASDGTLYYFPWIGGYDGVNSHGYYNTVTMGLYHGVPSNAGFFIGMSWDGNNADTFYYFSRTGDFTAPRVRNAVWNDYAECRAASIEEPGRVVIETSTGIMRKSTDRLQAGASVVSDTYGTLMGETELCKTPIAVAGRVLVYTYEDRDSYPLGAAVCTGPNGTVSLMTREEVREYPERIVGTVSEIPKYETWGTGNVKVNGRIWIKVR